MNEDDGSSLSNVFSDLFDNVGYSSTTVTGSNGTSSTVTGVSIGGGAPTITATPGQIVAAGNPALGQQSNLLLMAAVIAVAFLIFRK